MHGTVIKVRACRGRARRDLESDVDAVGQCHDADDGDRGRQHSLRSQYQDGHSRRALPWADGQRHQQCRWLDQDQVCRLDRVRRQQVSEQGQGPAATQANWRRHRQDHHYGSQSPHRSWPLLPSDQSPQGRRTGDHDGQDGPRLGPTGQWQINRLVKHAISLASSTTGRPAIIGKRMATADLAIRTTSGAGGRTVAEVKKGTALSVTGAIQHGRAQIIYKGAVRWVTAKYLANLTSNLPSLPKLPKITGKRYATATLNIRSIYTAKYRLITEVPRGTKLTITGVVKDGRMQIVFEKTVRWVTAKYLSKSSPRSMPPSWRAVESGLKPNAIKVHRAARAKFPQITTYYTLRSGMFTDHSTGRALDLMIPNYKSASGKAFGYKVAAWAKANAKPLGINYVIWNQHIWNIQRDSEGWRYVADRGGDSANHKNHVHITVFADGFDPR
jgi:uncharacterized protein YgiM (DUF1202 family)